MEYQSTDTDHPKRRRRRRVHRSPDAGWLIPDEHLRGITGRISQALFLQLFPYRSSPRISASGKERILHIAVTPSTAILQESVEDVPWTVLPVEVQGEREGNRCKSGSFTIHLPAKSAAFQTFAETLQQGTIAKSRAGEKQGFEVRILDVEPLTLKRIYVVVDGNALEKHEEVQKKFGGGFHSSRSNGFVGKGKGKAKATSHTGFDVDEHLHVRELEDRLTKAVRDALSMLLVVRQNEPLHLPLPAHPITHVPLPPAKILLCEPVSQGVLSDETKIVVNRLSHNDAPNRSLQSLATRKALRSMIMEDGNDSSNEQFVSALENRETDGSAGSDRIETSSDSNSPGSDNEGSSDDSMENVISLSTPQLQSRSSGLLSSRFTSTPRVAGPRTDGIDTPGSVFSNFTAKTARQNLAGRGRLFRPKPIACRIEDNLLHPRPTVDDDDEARVFVDVKSLLKLGCFSGDWVKLQATSASDQNSSGVWDVDSFCHADSPDDFRPAKIYGLPELTSDHTHRYARGDISNQTSSTATVSGSDSHQMPVWLSPILLVNLGQAPFIRLFPFPTMQPEGTSSKHLRRGSKISASASPPIAKEMTVMKISTPVSTEKALQTGIFSSLKQYFENRRRILRQGDIIPLRIDTSASRLLTQPVNTSDGDIEAEEILCLSLPTTIQSTKAFDVAWFEVGQIIASESSDNHQIVQSGIWGGSACIESMTTRMRQIGSEERKVPSSLDSSWERYLRLKPTPKTRLSQSHVGQATSSSPRSYISPMQRRLRELMAAATSPRAHQFGMDPLIVLLHSTQRNIGKKSLASYAASDLGLHVFDMNVYDLIAEGGSAGDVKTEGVFKARVERALSCGASCTAILIRHVEGLTAERMIGALKEAVTSVRVLVATTTEIDNIPENLRSIFTHELEVLAPDEGEREGILKNIIDDRGIRLAHDVDLAAVAVKTAALVAGNLSDIVDRAVVARQDRLENLVFASCDDDGVHCTVRDALVSGGQSVCCVTKADFDLAMDAARKNFADAIGAPKIPNVSWDDVGGLENVKDAVLETIQLPLERPELFAKGMKKRSGILFYGPPGTGKTLLAKAIATEFSLNFFSVKGPELLNMYIGESEANVRRVFQRARDARPCVVFFDELDSVAPKRGNQGDSGGVMDRIVSQLLAELDGMSDGEDGGGGVFVIGATNRPDLLDQALLRPGRFDKMLYLGVSDTHDKQRTIMQALTRKFTMHPETSLQRVADALPFTYTGADLYALCSDAMLKAITRQASAVDRKIKALPEGPVTTAYFFDHLATEEDIAVMVLEDDFFAAQKELVSSVSAKELEHYQRVRRAFEGSSSSLENEKSPSIKNPTRIPAPKPEGHIHPPVLTKRPKLKSRTSTAKPKVDNSKDKGKGKATRWASDDDDEGDDAYVTSNDYVETPERRNNGANGAFGNVGEGDDEEIYG